MYLGSMHGLYRIHLPTARRVILTKHTSFDESLPLFSQKRTIHTDEAKERKPSVENKQTVFNRDAHTLKDKPPTRSYTDLSDEDRSVQQEDDEETPISRTSPRRTRKLSKTFCINALSRSHTEDEPSEREPLADQDREIWQHAMEKSANITGFKVLGNNKTPS